MIRWQLAYRGRWGREVAEVEATTEAKAEELGRAWCLKTGNKYIRVTDAVVAREEVPKIPNQTFGKAS